MPERLETVTPRLVVGNGAGAIAFYVQAFGAEEVGERFLGPDGELVHAEIRIGDSVVMLTEASDHEGPIRAPLGGTGSVTAIMATYWEDVDAAWARAVAAGAEVIYPLENHFYGERGGRVRDPFGQQWMMSQLIEELTAAQVRAGATGLTDS